MHSSDPAALCNCKRPLTPLRRRAPAQLRCLCALRIGPGRRFDGQAQDTTMLDRAGRLHNGSHRYRSSIENRHIIAYRQHPVCIPDHCWYRNGVSERWANYPGTVCYGEKRSGYAWFTHSAFPILTINSYRIGSDIPVPHSRWTSWHRDRQFSLYALHPCSLERHRSRGTCSESSRENGIDTATASRYLGSRSDAIWGSI
jgi:hypothetical protein